MKKKSRKINEKIESITNITNHHKGAEYKSFERY